MLTEQRFIDDQGRLRQWPAKQSDKLLALAYLATKFSFGSIYNENDVNNLLKKWHTFNDWPLLRRELYERGFLERNIDCSDYHVMRIKTALPDLYLTTPNIASDPALSVQWLDGDSGRNTLRLMGNTEAHNKPSNLPAEQERIRGFITSFTQRTWSLRYQGKSVGAIWVDLSSNKYLAAPSVHIMIGNPDVRGKGIGQAALQEVIAILQQESEHQVLYSRHLIDNIGSAKLLAKSGFSNDGESYEDDDGLNFQNVKRLFRLP